MKYFIAIALIAAVTSAGVIKPSLVSGKASQVGEIIAAINSPSTEPATAALLREMLFYVIGVNPTPIAVKPAIVEGVHPISVGPAIVEDVHPIAVGPALVDFPVPDGGAATQTYSVGAPSIVGPADHFIQIFVVCD